MKNTKMLPVSQIIFDPNPIRKSVTERLEQGLKVTDKEKNESSNVERSIQSNGFTFPVLVVEYKDIPASIRDSLPEETRKRAENETIYIIVDGRNRTNIAIKQGIKEIPAIIAKPESEQDFYALSFAGNTSISMDRKTYVKRAKELSGRGLTLKQIADQLSVSETQVLNYLAVSGISEDIGDLIAEGKTTIQKALLLLKYKRYLGNYSDWLPVICGEQSTEEIENDLKKLKEQKKVDKKVNPVKKEFTPVPSLNNDRLEQAFETAQSYCQIADLDKIDTSDLSDDQIEKIKTELIYWLFEMAPEDISRQREIFEKNQ